MVTALQLNLGNQFVEYEEKTIIILASFLSSTENGRENTKVADEY
jgi:hypothetical protein